MNHISSIEAIEFQIASEVRCNEKGEAFYSFRATSRLCGLSPATLSESINPKEGDRRSTSKLFKFLTGQGLDVIGWVSTGIPKDGLKAILIYYSFYARRNQNSKALQSLQALYPKEYGAMNTIPKGKHKKTEKQYQLDLAQKERGLVEVSTIAGNIDVLTSTQVIEVKDIKGWKSALGQVIAYGSFYPSHQKRIHLFGETQEKYLTMISEIALTVDVIVTWEN